MGSIRRDSERRRALREQLEPDDRPTLFPCPVCAGRGKVITEVGHGRYRGHDCRWCNGTGSVDYKVQRAYTRWVGILNRNRRIGRCSLERDGTRS